MNLYQLSRLRTWFGKLGALLCLALFLALADGLVFQIRKPFNILEVFPGTAQAVDGPVPEQVENLQDLRYSSSSPHFRLTFLEIMKGFWLGNRRWRGELAVSPQAPPGTYRLEVAGQKGTSVGNPHAEYTITVFGDLESFRQQSKSLAWRHLGYSPWRVAVMILPLMALSLGVVMLLSRRMDAVMARSGRAELYQVTKREGDYLVAFGLGTDHGVNPGDALYLFNDEGQLLGMVEVAESNATDSLGVARVGGLVRPGFFVSRQFHYQ